MARKSKQSPRRLESKRATRLRGKKRAGQELSADDEEWLAAYDASKRPPGRPRKDDGEADDESSDDDGADVVDADDESTADDETKVDAASDAPHGDAAGAASPPPPAAVESPPPSPAVDAAPAFVPPPPLPKAPRNPVPPRVRIRVDGDDAPAGKKGGAWQDKYKGEAQAGNREQTCLLIGGYWLGMLTQMADALKSAGIDPIVKPETLGGAIVLTLDEILPDTVEVTPKVMAVGGSTAILVQRFMRREDIAKAAKTAKERKDHDAWREEQRRAKEKAEETRTAATATSPIVATAPIATGPSSATPAAAPAVSASAEPSRSSAPTSARRESTPLQSAINGAAKENRDDVIYEAPEFNPSDPKVVY